MVGRLNVAGALMWDGVLACGREICHAVGPLCSMKNDQLIRTDKVASKGGVRHTMGLLTW